MRWFSVVLLFVSSRWSVSSETPPVIQTKSGPVQGQEFPGSANKTVMFYSGIPYAEPPVRFSPPVPVKPWSEVFQAIGKHKMCIQQFIPGLAYHGESPTSMSEDCLRLNLLVPGSNPVNVPVLVYIHGGTFSVGSVHSDPALLASMVSDEDIIIAAMNYRLNVFGFASLGIPEVPGNLGLMDQHLALKWIKQNIESFGGNPNRITLLGMSAGSSCVNHHLMANRDPELFHGAIMMSGTASERMISEPDHIVAKTGKLVALVGCSANNESAILDCLRGKPVQDLLRAEPATRSFYTDFFKPSVDGIYVKEHPEISVITGNFIRVPVLAGVTSNEGSRFAYELNRVLFKSEDGALSSHDVRKAMQNLLGPDASPVTLEASLLFYTNYTAPEDQLENRDAVMRAYGDSLFVCGTNNFCDRYAKAGGTVYKYVYDQKVFGSNWMSPSHSSDLPMVLGFSLQRGVLDEQEEAFCRRLMRQWATFARTGNPNVAGDGSPLWPRYNVARRPHMIQAYQSSLGNNFRVRECSFWTKLLPSIKTLRKC